jgi:hypothetical protein
MANFLKLTSQTESRLGQYATRLFRVEAHLRQGEKRAARRRLEGFAEELEEFERELEFPLEMMIVGGQLGFFSGKGSILRGRIPGAILGTVAGWFFGQSTACSYREAIDELKMRVRVLEIELLKQSQEEAEAPASEQSKKTDRSAADKEKVPVGDEPED